MKKVSAAELEFILKFTDTREAQTNVGNIYEDTF